MTDAPPAYRELLTRLNAERARADHNSTAARTEEARWIAEGLAVGLKIAACHAITLFEGHEARQAYLAGEHPALAAPGPEATQTTELDTPTKEQS